LKWLQICEFLIEIICILFLNTTLFYNFILPVNKYLAERRKARKFLGYFVWKITILRQKILFFLIAEGGAKILGISCEKLRFYAKKIIFFPILGGGASAGCAPLWIRPWLGSEYITSPVINTWFIYTMSECFPFTKVWYQIKKNVLNLDDLFKYNKYRKSMFILNHFSLRILHVVHKFPLNFREPSSNSCYCKYPRGFSMSYI
jgi:hypothetical protein